MKRATLLVFMFASVLVYGQKPVKPNINKALSLMKEGKLTEAKEMIDAATTYEKTMNDGKTYYYRGLIYASIDTTSNPAFKDLAQEPLKTAMESFAKADQMGKAGTEYFTNDANSVIPITKTTQLQNLGNYYINKGAKLYNDEPEAALVNFEKTMIVNPKDTLATFYAGIVANSLESYDKALDYFNKYIDLGGTQSDAYSISINIYSTAKQDKEKALEVTRKAMAKYPKNDNFPKVEIQLLIDLNKIEEAKTGLETAIKKEPNNKVLHFYLGYLNTKLEKLDDAKKNYEEALKVDPAYFDAQVALAQIYYYDAALIKKEMDNLGISAADKKKKADLDKVLVDKYKIALPYWEKAEKMNGSDTDVLDKLSAIYYFLGDDINEKRIAKKRKELGIEN